MSMVLSPGGYQTLLAVMNRQRVIGEIEDASTDDFIDKVLEACPGLVAYSVFDLAQQCPEASGEKFTEEYIVIGGAKPAHEAPQDYNVGWEWTPPPGSLKRYKQFEQYTIALFGEIGSQNWAIRFEGHHVSINLTFETDPETQELTVNNTPLFIGTFPLVIPTDRYPSVESPLTQWEWTQSQLMMYKVTYHLRQFWQTLPPQLQRQSFISPDFFNQEAPLESDTPPPWLLTAADLVVDPGAIDNYPHVTLTASQLSDAAKWRLEQAFKYYANNMSNDVGDQYSLRVANALANNGSLTIAWSGGDLADFGSHHFSHIRVGNLLLEFQQSNQWSSQHDPNMRGNHVHSMLRDLSFPWSDHNPLVKHIHSDHKH